MAAVWQKHRRLLIVAVSCLFLWLCNFLFFGYSIEIEYFDQQRVEAAYQYWQEHEIKDYHAVISVASMAELAQYTLLVEDGQVVSATRQDMLNAPQVVSPEWTHDFTINALFDLGMSKMQSVPSINLTCFQFDVDVDAEFGYLKSIRGYCRPGCAIGDCNFGYSVIEFEPMTS